MKLTFRITDQLLGAVHADLNRPHPFAGERVGFLTCGVGALPGDGLAIYAAAYQPVLDEDYVEDHRVAAMLGSRAFRRMLQIAYRDPTSVFHVHRHDHPGLPSPSHTDETESARFVPDFWKVCPNHPHGIIILSLDSMCGRVWHPTSRQILPFTGYKIVGEHPPAVEGTLDERA